MSTGDEHGVQTAQAAENAETWRKSGQSPEDLLEKFFFPPSILAGKLNKHGINRMHIHLSGDSKQLHEFTTLGTWS